MASMLTTTAREHSGRKDTSQRATFLPGPLHSPTLGTSFPEACRAGRNLEELELRWWYSESPGKGCDWQRAGDPQQLPQDLLAQLPREALATHSCSDLQETLQAKAKVCPGSIEAWVSARDTNK